MEINEDILVEECVQEILYRIDDLVREYNEDAVSVKAADIIKNELKKIMIKHLNERCMLYRAYYKSER